MQREWDALFPSWNINDLYKFSFLSCKDTLSNIQRYSKISFQNDVESQINLNYFIRMDHFDHSYAKKTLTELMQDGMKAELL